MITSDIELLEVFYAHTISPIIIAVLTSGIMAVYIGQYHWSLGIASVLSYLLVGAVIPLVVSKRGRKTGLLYREQFGEMNSYFLDSLRGITEIIQYGWGEKRLEEIRKRTEELEKNQERLKTYEGDTRAVTDLAVLLCSAVILFLAVWLKGEGKVTLEGVLIPTLAMMSSFGPVVALSNLSNNLFQTLASGNRVLDLLEEAPLVDEVEGEEKVSYTGMQCEEVTFSYGKECILQDYSMEAGEGEIVGIFGPSGSGKSTLLKLMMRFFDADQGRIMVSGKNICDINTKDLREMESYVTQETHLFHDTIAANIGIAKEGASREEIEAAAKRASLHAFIQSLPNGYDTNVGELGESLSGGERQRIGVARAFLHDGPLILMDEPTSNLDSLNEGVILKAMAEERREKTIILVSHRKSTMKIADRILSIHS